LTRRTANPLSSLKKVTRSTRPAISSVLVLSPEEEVPILIGVYRSAVRLRSLIVGFDHRPNGPVSRLDEELGADRVGTRVGHRASALLMAWTDYRGAKDWRRKDVKIQSANVDCRGSRRLCLSPVFGAGGDCPGDSIVGYGHMASLGMTFYPTSKSTFPSLYDGGGRPAGVTIGHDGALYVTDDGSRSIGRVTYTGK
jgi:hypothetical protein